MTVAKEDRTDVEFPPLQECDRTHLRVVENDGRVRCRSSFEERFDDVNGRESRAQNRSVFEMSSVMALSAVGTLPEKVYWLSRSAKLAGERTGQMFAGTLLEHYRNTLSEISDVGFLRYWTQQFRPYLQTAASQFSPQHSSLTERLLGKDQ